MGVFFPTKISDISHYNRKKNKKKGKFKVKKSHIPKEEKLEPIIQHIFSITTFKAFIISKKMHESKIIQTEHSYCKIVDPPVDSENNVKDVQKLEDVNDVQKYYAKMMEGLRKQKVDVDNKNNPEHELFHNFMERLFKVQIIIKRLPVDHPSLAVKRETVELMNIKKTEEPPDDDFNHEANQYKVSPMITRLKSMVKPYCSKCRMIIKNNIKYKTTVKQKCNKCGTALLKQCIQCNKRRATYSDISAHLKICYKRLTGKDANKEIKEDIKYEDCAYKTVCHDELSDDSRIDGCKSEIAASKKRDNEIKSYCYRCDLITEVDIKSGTLTGQRCEECRNIKIWKCAKCDKQFPNYVNAEHHLRLVCNDTNVMVKSSTLINAATNCSTTKKCIKNYRFVRTEFFTCLACNKSYSKFEYFKLHLPNCGKKTAIVKNSTKVKRLVMYCSYCKLSTKKKKIALSHREYCKRCCKSMRWQCIKCRESYNNFNNAYQHITRNKICGYLMKK